MIDAHIIDARGVYLRTETVDPMGPQFAGAVYETLPGKKAGSTRVWDGTAWLQIKNADVPSPPEPQQPPPEPAPAFCTRRQGLNTLLTYGHRRADIEALIGAIPDEIEREAALNEYEAATWERANPFLQHIWAQLGGTPEQLDEVFRVAATL